MPQDTLPDVQVAGSDADIPVYSDIAGAVNSWGDGHVNLADFTATADAGLGILGAALDPEGAVVGAVVGWLMNFVVDHIGPLKKALDDLLGDPDAVSAIADKWIFAAQEINAIGQAHAQYANDTPSWTGPAADAYKTVLSGENGLYPQASGSAAGMAGWINVAGGIVGVFRGMVWDAIKDFLTQVIEAGIAALASSWFTFGGSLGVFTGWFFGKLASMCAKLTHNFAKLLRKLAALARKLHLSGDKFDQAARKLGQVSTRLSQRARRSYRMSVRPDPTLHVPWNKDGKFWENHPGLEKTKENYEKYKDGVNVINAPIDAQQRAGDKPEVPEGEDGHDWVK